MLAFAPDFRWLILAFHVIIKLLSKYYVANSSWGQPSPAVIPQFGVREDSR
jgi:hypothetical protein